MGGSGGRIALHAHINEFQGTLSARGSSYRGPTGTLYFELRDMLSTQPWVVGQVFSRVLQVEDNGYQVYRTALTDGESLAVDRLVLAEGSQLLLGENCAL